MDSTKPTDAEIARQLDIDKSVVHRMKKRGMPTDSVAAAREWRDANLNPNLRKDTNLARARVRRGGNEGVRTALLRVETLRRAAESALKAQLFHAIEPELRTALRAVPHDARLTVKLPEPVWDALCKSPPSAQVHAASAVPGRNDPVQWWFAVAAGEVTAIHR